MLLVRVAICIFPIASAITEYQQTFEASGTKKTVELVNQSRISAVRESPFHAWTFNLGQKIRVVAPSPNGKYFLAVTIDGSWKGEARVWNARSRKEVKNFGHLGFVGNVGHRGSVTSAVWTAGSNEFLTASGEKTAKLWSVANGSLVREFGPLGSRYAVEFATLSQSGERVVTACTKGWAVWDLSTGHNVADLSDIGHDMFVLTAIALSPDGTRVAIGFQDHGKNAAAVLDATPPKLVSKLRDPTQLVGSADFSPDGLRVVTACYYEDIARVWNAGTGRVEFRFDHPKGVTSAMFSPTGNEVVTAGSDKTVKVWNAKTGKLEHDLVGHTGTVRSAAFWPGRPGELLTASDDGTVRSWRFEVDTPFFAEAP